jgi:hypothetical protein
MMVRAFFNAASHRHNRYAERRSLTRTAFAANAGRTSPRRRCREMSCSPGLPGTHAQRALRALRQWGESHTAG